MMNEAKMTELTQAEDMAFFRADLCLYSPESYSLEEKKEICSDMFKTSKAIQDAMRADFEQLPPDARAKLLDMLCASGVESRRRRRVPQLPSRSEERLARARAGAQTSRPIAGQASSFQTATKCPKTLLIRSQYPPGRKSRALLFLVQHGKAANTRKHTCW